MWQLDHKEGWALKNGCLKIVMLEKTLESPLNSKEIKPVNLKGNQPWILNGRTDAEAEAPTLWPLLWRVNSLEKTLRLGKATGKGGDRDEMVGQHHRLHGHEFEQAPGDSEGQGNSVCCSHGVAKSRTWFSKWTKIQQLHLHNCVLHTSHLN